MSDFPLESPEENLSWALKQTGYDDGKTDSAGLTINPALSFPWPDDPDERIWAPVFLSLNEYTALLSAVDVGAAIAWTNDALLVYYILVRNFSGGSMQFCEKVADCFENDAAFRESVINSLSNDPMFQQMITNFAGRSTLPQIEGALFGGDCDEDVVAGRVVAIIDKLNTRNVDFLEIVEVGTNDEERVASVLSAIPALGESPVDEIINLIQGFLEDFTENYNAAITDDWLDEVYGDLFCIALEKPDCAMTFKDVFDYFSQRAGSSLTIGSVISNIFSYVVNGDFSTDDLVASGMYTINLAFILAGREFNGMSVPSMGAIARDSSPTSAWMDWAPCVPLDCDDLTAGMQGYSSVTPTSAQYATGLGFWHSSVNASYLFVRKNTTGQTITEVVIKLSRSMADLTDAFVAIYPYSDTGQSSPYAASTALLQEYTFSGLTVTDGLIIYVSSGGSVLPDDMYLIEVCYATA